MFELESEVIELTGLYKKFGDITAVKNLNLDVRAGELFGFLGPNGAGKTTTIKMMAGLIRPTSGSIMINGLNLTTHAVAVKKVVGYVPDTPFIYEKLTGREFLRFVAGLFQLENRVAQRRIDTYLDLFDLTEWAEELVEHYSHGMKQKLVMSSALIHSPLLLIVDEPMVGLDPKSALIVKNLFKQLTTEGTTIFLSTHTLSIAEQLCSRIGIIQRGSLIALGTIEELRMKSMTTINHLEEIFLQLTGEPDYDKITESLE